MILFINVITLQTMKSNSYIINNFMYLHSSGCCYLLKYLLLVPEMVCFRSSWKNSSTLDFSSFPFSFFFFFYISHIWSLLLFMSPVYCDRHCSSNSSVAGPWTGEGCHCLLIITCLAMTPVQKHLSKRLC